MKKIFSLILLLSGCGVSEKEELLINSNKEFLTSYNLNSTDSIVGKIKWKSNFQVNTTYDIYFASDITDLSGTHQATLIINIPTGDTWQRSELPFNGSKRTTRIWFSMPVAGTFIESYNLTGNWTAYLYVDNTLVDSLVFNLY